MAFQTENQSYAEYGIEVDVWSFACVVYFVETGCDLFSGVKSILDLKSQYQSYKTIKMTEFGTNLMEKLLVLDQKERLDNWTKMRPEIEIIK